tara:strand:+ start:627 stop:1070 length:444 start_codon:yes stop_codon:yes gene_type:complete
MKRRPLGPSPEELEKAQGLDLSKSVAYGHRAKAATKTYRTKEDPIEKRKRDRREFISKMDKKRHPKRSKIPFNCVLCYVPPETWDQILALKKRWICDKDSVSGFQTRTEISNGTTFFIIDNDDIKRWNMMHVVHFQTLMDSTIYSLK